MTTAKLTSTLRYTGPGSDIATPAFTVETPDYAALSAGKLDYAGSATGAQTVPFGSVGNPTAIVLKNTHDVDVLLTLSAFRMAPGSVLIYVGPVAVGAAPLAAATITPSATGAATGSLEYVIAGDS